MRWSINSGISQKLKLSKLFSRLALRKLIAVLGSTILYIVLSVYFLRTNPDMSALIAIPVAMAGWYFGVFPGLIASVLGMALSALLLQDFSGGRNWFSWLIAYWPDNLMLIGAGFLGGRMQEMLSARTSLLKDGLSRDRYLTLVNMTIRDILAPPNIEDRYHYLVAHLVNLFVADYAYLVLWDATREQALLAASTVPMEDSASEVILGPDESDAAISILNTGRAQAIEDVPGSAQFANCSIFRDLSPAPQSAVCVPLIAGGQKLGVAVIAYTETHHFEEKEITYAEFATDQFALALWTVQQDVEINKQLKVANTLVDIERALSQTERVGLKTVLQLIVDSARELIPGAENAVLHLLDSDQETLVPRAVSGEDSKTRTRVNMRLGEGVAGQAIADGEVIGVSDILSDPRFVNPAAAQKVRSLVVAPIRSGEKPFGSISVYSEHPRSFTSEAISLLGALGTHAAVAIENVNLMDTTRQDLKEINALYHISRGLASSLDPDQLMKDVVDLLKQDLDYYHVQIFVLDPTP
jgi:GAF domain-containing protein